LPSLDAVTVEGGVNLQTATEFARARRDPRIGLLRYLQRPDQDPRGIALAMGHHIQTVVNPVDAIDVELSWRAK
jgi:hypothetical protein